MIAIERSTGNPYANDPAYDALHGRLVGEYTVKRVDAKRNCTVWTTYEVIDLGRREAIAPCDPDAQLSDELLPYIPGMPGNPGIQGETVRFMQDICKLLANGPMSMAQIVKATGAGNPRIGALFEKYGKSFGITCKRGANDGRKWYWQLVTP